MKLLQALALALEIKAQECGHRTQIDYRSYIRNLKHYLSINDRLTINLNQFSKRDALHYLDYLLIEKKLEPVSRNNNLRGLKALLNVLKAREYISENNLDSIKYFKVKQKRRKVFSRVEPQIIMNYVKGIRCTPNVGQNLAEFTVECSLFWMGLLHNRSLVKGNIFFLKKPSPLKALKGLFNEKNMGTRPTQQLKK